MKTYENEKAIYFDMDGTLGDFYNVEGWLEKLLNSDPYPYAAATPLHNFNEMISVLSQLQEAGYIVGIVSWLSKNGTPEYNKEVRQVKREWLNKYFPDFSFDEIHIVKYGTPKRKCVNYKGGILFDDEEKNRKSWHGRAYTPEKIMEILNSLL